jgi:hypothetical protein
MKDMKLGLNLVGPESEAPGAGFHAKKGIFVAESAGGSSACVSNGGSPKNLKIEKHSGDQQEFGDLGGGTLGTFDFGEALRATFQTEIDQY